MSKHLFGKRTASTRIIQVIQSVETSIQKIANENNEYYSKKEFLGLCEELENTIALVITQEQAIQDQASSLLNKIHEKKINDIETEIIEKAQELKLVFQETLKLFKEWKKSLIIKAQLKPETIDMKLIEGRITQEYRFLSQNISEAIIRLRNLEKLEDTIEHALKDTLT